jgi:hypothetical protein
LQYVIDNQHKIKRWFDLLDVGDVICDVNRAGVLELFEIQELPLHKTAEIPLEILGQPITMYELRTYMRGQPYYVGFKVPARVLVPPRTDIVIV